jgi:hypothetical protein
MYCFGQNAYNKFQTTQIFFWTHPLFLAHVGAACAREMVVWAIQTTALYAVMQIIFYNIAKMVLTL